MTASVDLNELIAQLERIVVRAKQLEVQFADELAHVHPDFEESARNLIAYLALRHVDMRELQQQLASTGLSSLGEAERDVMASIRTAQKLLGRLAGGDH